MKKTDVDREILVQKVCDAAQKVVAARAALAVARKRLRDQDKRVASQTGAPHGP